MRIYNSLRGQHSIAVNTQKRFNEVPVAIESRTLFPSPIGGRITPPVLGESIVYADGMLATEPAQGPFRHPKRVVPLHSHSHLDMSSVAPAGLMPQPLQYASNTTTPNMNAVQHDNLTAPVSNVPPQSFPSDVPQQDDNIMNRKADMNSSLFQICLALRMRLAEVPGFGQHIAEMEEEEAEIEDSSDPVTSMWNCLRRGYPLMTLYNALKPSVPLRVDQTLAEAKIGKTATYKFLQACLTEQKFPPNECFRITDLYGGDTTGFVKVSRTTLQIISHWHSSST